MSPWIIVTTTIAACTTLFAAFWGFRWRERREAIARLVLSLEEVRTIIEQRASVYVREAANIDAQVVEMEKSISLVAVHGMGDVSAKASDYARSLIFWNAALIEEKPFRPRHAYKQGTRVKNSGLYGDARKNSQEASQSVMEARKDFFSEASKSLRIRIAVTKAIILEESSKK